MIRFQLNLEVAPENAAALETTYAEVFEPALRRQEGFVKAELVRVFAPEIHKEIQALPTDYNYRVMFMFESEELRRKWATSPDHDVAWPKMEALTKRAGWRGYDVLRTSD